MCFPQFLQWNVFLFITTIKYLHTAELSSLFISLHIFQSGPSCLFPNEQEELKISFVKSASGETSIITEDTGIEAASSIVLPKSIVSELNETSNIKLFVSYYDTGTMFPLESVETEAENKKNISSVIATSIVAENVHNLPDDIIININLRMFNYTNATCVSWNFTANGMEQCDVNFIGVNEIFQVYTIQLQKHKEVGQKMVVSYSA